MDDKIRYMRDYFLYEEEKVDDSYRIADEYLTTVKIEICDHTLEEHLKNIRQLYAKLVLECAKALTHINSRPEKNG